jgi:hypothetical protein
VTLGKEVLCRVLGPYHSTKNQDLGIGIGSLPSVMSLALGKEARFVECHTKHSAKYLTWGPPLANSLPSAVRPTLGKGNSFAECRLGHSAKTPSPSPVAVTAAFLCRVHKKKYSAKTALPMHCMSSPLCRVRHSAKRLPSVFKALPSASGTRQSRRFR